MKSACVSFVRNEEDIIEVFVRYHAKIFDHMFIIEHNCKDGTSEILDKMVKEGLPLTTSKVSTAFHDQGKCITDKLREIRKKHRLQAVVCLDADEFIVGDIKRAAFELPGPTHTLALTWKNYAPTEKDIDSDNVLKRITHCNSLMNYTQHKILIPGPMLDYPTFVKEGCHELYFESSMVNLVRSKHVHLAHFPIRSHKQFMKKALVGWISKCANPENRGVMPDWSHWKSFFDIAKKGTSLSLHELQCLALGYTVDHQSSDFSLIHEPVSCDEVDILYPIDDKEYGSLESLADAAEILALEFSKVGCA